MSWPPKVTTPETPAAVTWDSLPGKPTFSAIAMTGNYADINSRPNINAMITNMLSTSEQTEATIHSQLLQLITELQNKDTSTDSTIANAVSVLQTAMQSGDGTLLSAITALQTNSNALQTAINASQTADTTILQQIATLTSNVNTLNDQQTNDLHTWFTQQNKIADDAIKLLITQQAANFSSQIGALPAPKVNRKVVKLVNINSANTDVAQITGLPAKYMLMYFKVFDASSNFALSLATIGLYTASGGGGNIAALTLLTALTTALKVRDIALLTTDILTNTTLYVRCGVPHGSAATVSVEVMYVDLTD